MINKKIFKVLIAGGCGFWADKTHFPAIIQLKREGIPVKVVGIIDAKNPERVTNKINMKQIVEIDNPEWVDVSGRKDKEIEKKMDELNSTYKIDLMIVSTNPVYHYFYSKWAMMNGISVLCDKPLVVTRNASFDLRQALMIQKQLEDIEKLYRKAKKVNSKYMFCTSLRRRALAPFLDIAKGLTYVEQKTGEGIKYMNVIVNSGLHRYPIEFTKGGAHGYLDGVGSLVHSSFHYIDLIAWYLQIAKGNATKISVSLQYISRVKDYLNNHGYKNIKKLIEGENNGIEDEVVIPTQVSKCELDFIFHLKLLDDKNIPVGLISYTSNHTSFTPRLTKYHPDMTDPAYETDGGRMSQLYIDIHQGALQNWQLIKNDIVFHGNEIQIVGRQHPKIGNLYLKKEYKDAYNSETTPTDLLKALIKYLGEFETKSKELSSITAFEDQKLTNRLFSKFYELIANDYETEVLKKNKKTIESTINIADNLI